MQKGVLEYLTTLGGTILEIVSLFQRGATMTTTQWILAGLGGFFIIFGILYSIWNNRSNRPVVKPKLGSALPIQKINHGKRPPTFLSLVWVIYMLIILAIGLYFLHSSKSAIRFNGSLVLFAVLFLFFPIYVLLDIFVISKKYYRFNRSAVVKDADFVIDGNINYIYDNYRRLLNSMIAPNTKLTEQFHHLIKGYTLDSKIIIEIKHKKNLVNVYLISDDKWIMATQDNESIQNNLNKLIDLLYHMDTFEAK